jgi:hypothetical protein
MTAYGSGTNLITCEAQAALGCVLKLEGQPLHHIAFETGLVCTIPVASLSERDTRPTSVLHSSVKVSADFLLCLFRDLHEFWEQEEEEAEINEIRDPSVLHSVLMVSAVSP